MDSNSLYKGMAFGLLYLAEMLLIYLHGRKSFPKLAMRLTLTSFILLLAITFYSAALGTMLSLVAMISYLFILKKPDQRMLLQQFYVDNKIYSTQKKPSEATLKILGNKNWTFAEGTVTKMNGEPVNYLFCQGYTSRTVSTGQYGHTTAYTHYLAFVFWPGTVSNIFKQNAIAAAEKKYPFRQRLKYFFSINTNKPHKVTTAEDGSFIIEYLTIVDLEHYAKQLSLIKENMRRSYFPVTEMIVAN
jgi:hypothetical protein